MGIQAPPSQHCECNILSPHFQFSGQLETVGPAGYYINDPARTSFSLHDARMAPFTPGSPMKGIIRPHIVIIKSEIVFLYLASEEARTSVSLFARREQMMFYTPIGVCRGHMPMPAEGRIGDFLNVVPGELLPILDAQIFPFIDLPAPFPTQAEMILLGRSHLTLYHAA
jgi:hypothetical protein